MENIEIYYFSTKFKILKVIKNLKLQTFFLYLSIDDIFCSIIRYDKKEKA